MRLSISKSKKSERLYIVKSVKVDGKYTTKIIKKLGTMDSLLPDFDNDRQKVISWAESEAKRLTDLEKEEKVITLTFDSNKLLDSNVQTTFNIGYLFIEDIYYKLKLDEICRDISKDYNLPYKLSDIFSAMLFTKIIAPSEILSFYNYSSNFLEGSSFSKDDADQSYILLAEHSKQIKDRVFENSKGFFSKDQEKSVYNCIYHRPKNLYKDLDIDLLDREFEAYCLGIDTGYLDDKPDFLYRISCLDSNTWQKAHVLVSSLSKLILKIIRERLNNKYIEKRIVESLRRMILYKYKDLGYLCFYNRTDITDSLHEAFGFRTDFRFIPQEEMDAILQKVKEG